jgi:hypothetical protein
MGTDYDTWILNIVEGDGDEPCEECGEDGCVCEHDDGPDGADLYEARYRD